MRGWNRYSTRIGPRWVSIWWRITPNWHRRDSLWMSRIRHTIWISEWRRIISWYYWCAYRGRWDKVVRKRTSVWRCMTVLLFISRWFFRRCRVNKPAILILAFHIAIANFILVTIASSFNTLIAWMLRTPWTSWILRNLIRVILRAYNVITLVSKTHLNFISFLISWLGCLISPTAASEAPVRTTTMASMMLTASTTSSIVAIGLLVIIPSDVDVLKIRYHLPDINLNTFLTIICYLLLSII